jgi:hypothetical protein
VAADVGDEHVLGCRGSESFGQFVGGYARSHVEQAILAVNPDAVDEIGGEADAKDDFRG